MANCYGIGSLVRVSGAFTTLAGADIDPTVVILQVQKPDLTEMAYTYLTDMALVRDSAGHYHLDVDVTASGTWYYRWHSTGTGQAAGEGQFQALTSEF